LKPTEIKALLSIVTARRFHPPGTTFHAQFNQAIKIITIKSINNRSLKEPNEFKIQTLKKGII
jgi:hypothetical protein